MRRNGTTICVAIIILSAINLLASFIYPASPWNDYLRILFLPGFPPQPWTFVTYPFAIQISPLALLNVVLACWWLYSMGGSVERELGSTRFAIFWVAMSVIPALLIWAGVSMLGLQYELAFLFLPLSAVTIAWATRNPMAIVTFMMIIPIQGRWLGWLTAGLVLFIFGVPHPQLGLIACIHLVLTYLYAANYIPFLPYGTARYVRNKEHWKKSERDDSYLRNVKEREMERAERERLRKLFEGSLSEDPEDKR